MKNVSSRAPECAIPGWRVIVSDTGRFWASRVKPFPGESEWYAPPFRTVDGDTFEQLRAEVERQEEAARNLEAVCDEAAEQSETGQTGGKEATLGTSEQVSR
ncbi:hypothetical protein GCM10017673_18360 [Streptosporangium violaceochromogenes]|nr:hypothetical protein GCM10017673_18360 [Streptosporangium violaceochromogenes]